MKVKTETPEEKEVLDMIDNTPAQFVELSSPTGNELLNTLNWFRQAVPTPTVKDACVQIGCAYEETAELANTMGDNLAMNEIYNLSSEYKRLESVDYINSMPDMAKVQMLDDIVDEIVTRIGIAHMMGFDIMSALAEVNRSNYSKFENGQPVFDENGKITKGKHYTPPNLTGMIGNERR